MNAAYDAVLAEAQRVRWPEHSVSDVMEHDRQTIDSLGESPRFVWILSRFSTRLVPLGVPCAADCMEPGSIDRQAKVYVYDGGLRAVTTDGAREFLLQQDVVRADVTPQNMVLAVPTYQELIASLPYAARSLPSVRENLRRLYVDEVAACIRYARAAKEPSVWMGLFHQSGHQHIAEFTVSDLAAPLREQYNLHLRNTSRWQYAGCVLVEGDRVSSHH